MKIKIYLKEKSKPVTRATAPTIIGGMAIIIQPTAATYDNICALKADLEESTR